MGYGLVREITANRPAGPGPEWWLLLDLAEDADDMTRRTMCGLDYMLTRTQAPRSTVLRWLKKLRDDGLIVTVERAAGSAAGRKGKRAVYEIQVPPRLAARTAEHLGLVPGSETRLMDSGLTGGDQTEPAGNGDSGLSEWDQSWPESEVWSHQVRPPTTGTSSDGAPLEGADLRSDQDRGENEERKNTLGPECEARRAPAA